MLGSNLNIQLKGVESWPTLRFDQIRYNIIMRLYEMERGELLKSTETEGSDEDQT